MEANDQLRTRDFLCLQLQPRNYRQATVHLLRPPTIKSLMGSVLSKPFEVTTDFAPHGIALEGNEDPSEPLRFQRKEEALGSRRSLGYSPLPRIDAFPIAPRLVPVAIDLTALVREDVLQSAVAFHESPQQRPDVDRLRFLLEHRKAHDASGMVINDARHPPTERPDLKNRKRQPRHPESGCRRK